MSQPSTSSASPSRSPSTRAHALVEAVTECLKGLRDLAPDWIAAECGTKGLDPLGPAAAEVIATGPLAAARTLELCRQSHRDLAAGRLPRLPGPVRTKDGIRTLRAMPALPYDRLMFRGFDCRVELGDGDVQAMPELTGGRGLVLGAGNVSSIPIADLTTLLSRGCAEVTVKLHPLHAPLLSIFERILEPLRALGCRLECGDAERAAFLLRDPGLTHVHLTGARTTFDAVRTTLAARGSGARLTAELGNVTPVIVAPSIFTARELDSAVDEVAAMLVVNGGYNCATPRVIVTARRWPQREEFLTRLQRALAAAGTRQAWHPGAMDRLAMALPQVRFDADRVPFTLITGLDPGVGLPAFRHECFAPLCHEVALDAPTLSTFMRDAVTFCNEQLEGDLVAQLMVSGRTLRDERSAVNDAVAALRYGTVAIAAFGALAFAFMCTPWGSFRPSPLGFVHDPWLLRDPRKTVLRAPVVVRPRPPWRIGGRHARATMQRMLDLTLAPSLPRALAVAVSALRR